MTGDELAGLALWHDANANGISEPGEVRPLAAHGITSLDCRWQASQHSQLAAWAPQGVRFQDGSTRPSYDVILQRR